MAAAAAERRGRARVPAAALAALAACWVSSATLAFVAPLGRGPRGRVASWGAGAGRLGRVARAARGGEAQSITFESLEVGQKHQGVVKSVTSFGAYVDIGCEANGFLHVAKVAEERVENLRDHLTVGQEVEVRIESVRTDRKFGLTMVQGKTGGRSPRRSGGGPRASAEQDVSAFTELSSDVWYKGVVASVLHFGAFVRVTLPDSGASAQGLVHISEISDGFLENIDDEVKPGQEVNVRVMSVDVGTNKIALSMKDPSFNEGSKESADVSAFEGFPVDEWIDGTVARFAPFGAFVTVKAPDSEEEVDGLVHITRIKDEYVEKIEDELEVGQEVKVRVISVDVEDGKLGLTMRSESDEDQAEEPEE